MKNFRLPTLAILICVFLWSCGSEDSNLDSGDIDVSLNTIGSTNLVITKNGLPVTSAKVQVAQHYNYYYQDQYGNGHIYLNFLQNTISEGTTSESGEYLIQDLPDDSYRARIEVLAGGRNEIYMITFEVFSGTTYQKKIELENYSGTLKFENGNELGFSYEYSLLEEFLDQFNQSKDSINVLKLYLIEDHVFDYFDLQDYVGTTYSNSSPSQVDSIISLYAIDSFNILSNSNEPLSISLPAGVYNIITKDGEFSKTSSFNLKPVKETTLNITSYTHNAGTGDYLDRFKQALLTSSWKQISTTSLFSSTSTIYGDQLSRLSFAESSSSSSNYLSVSITSQGGEFDIDPSVRFGVTENWDNSQQSYYYSFYFSSVSLSFLSNSINHYIQNITTDGQKLKVNYRVEGFLTEQGYFSDSYEALFELIK